MDVKVEVAVEINCSITSATQYEWKVFNSTELLDSDRISGLDKQLFHDPVLVLPRRSLPYGFYAVELKVIILPGVSNLSSGEHALSICSLLR